MTYETKTFAVPELIDISKTSVDQHIELYQGYVKNFNAISAAIEGLLEDPEKNALAISELRRRHSFEFDGMKLHELYFPQFEGGASAMNTESELAKAITTHWGSADAAEKRLKQTAMMRGPGWSILYFNPETKAFHMSFVGEQHQGHFATLPIVVALDVWEHAFLLDHGASGKAKYVEAFFKNLNWSAVEKRFSDIQQNIS
ncbi:MAG: manganese/iron superoxide dismutase-like protein superoxide dismutase, Fe-Mn family [Candidatus Adlerbacteria bacterium]|nr:manganese/iron superoxide dismutase-like protein superoxide dismutase, Fe-Mn family [Candidatus Adlerbacteria bacterium]